MAKEKIGFCEEHQMNSFACAKCIEIYMNAACLDAVREIYKEVVFIEQECVLHKTKRQKLNQLIEKIESKYSELKDGETDENKSDKQN